MSDDILEKVVLSKQAVTKWKKACEDFARSNKGKMPKNIPDEQAVMEPDGSLSVFVVLDDKRELRLRVPPEDWAWVKTVIL